MSSVECRVWGKPSRGISNCGAPKDDPVPQTGCKSSVLRTPCALTTPTGTVNIQKDTGPGRRGNTMAGHVGFTVAKVLGNSREFISNSSKR